MLRLFNSTQFRVHLTGTGLAACELRGHGRQRVLIRKVRFSNLPGGRRAVFAELERWISQKSRGASIHWVLGIAQARYLLLDWSPALLDRHLCKTVAGALFTQHYQQDPSQFTLQVATPAYLQPQLAAFVAKDLTTDIQMLAKNLHIRLSSVEPTLAPLWRRFSAILTQECGTLFLIDDDRQLLVHHTYGQPQSLALRPYDGRLPDSAGPNGQTQRVFSSSPVVYLPGQAGNSLTLSNAKGFVAQDDSAFSFALCGVF